MPSTSLVTFTQANTEYLPLNFPLYFDLISNNSSKSPYSPRHPGLSMQGSSCISPTDHL